MTNLPENKRPAERVALVERDLSYKIVGAGMQAYNELGYGFARTDLLRQHRDRVYRMGLRVEREVPVDVVFAVESSANTAWICLLSDA